MLAVFRDDLLGGNVDRLFSEDTEKIRKRLQK